MEGVANKLKWGLVIAAAPEADLEYIRRIYQTLPQPLTLCADGGLQKARRLGIPCDLLIGDMDSGGLEGADGGEGAEQIRLPAEKDFTDTQSCLEEAARRGCDAVVLTGASGGRLDHLLCNLHLLEALESRGVRGYLADKDNLVQLLQNGPVEVPACYRYFSLLPIDEKLEGVTIRGAKYPLENRTVGRADSLTVSNEASAGAVEIQIRRGRAFLIFSR